MESKRHYKRILLSMAMLLLLVFLTGCANQQPPENSPTPEVATPSTPGTGVYQLLTPQEAKAVIDEEQGVIILDVRTAEEYQAGHIANAKLLPVDEIKDKAAEALPDVNAKILVYCRSGRRSLTAANTLLEMGYTNVYDFGGIGSWPYDVVTD